MEMKRFTLDEANALLPQLQEDLHNLQELTSQMEDLFRELHKKKAMQLNSSIPQGEDPFFELEGRLDFMRMEVDLLMENFTRKGVLLKMIYPGLIDFPSELDGEEVLICWQEGEDRASHYHGWHDGFAGRLQHPDA